MAPRADGSDGTGRDVSATGASRDRIRVPLLFGLGGVAIGVALALSQSAAPVAAKTGQPAHITVTGTAQLMEAPNEAQLTLGTQVVAPTASGAMSEEGSRMTRIVSALTQVGVTRSQMETQGYNIYPNTNSSGTVTGFTVSDTLSIQLSDLAKVGAVLDAAVRHGANTVQNVAFTVANQSTDKVHAEGLALADAKRQAMAAAQNLHLRLGPVLSVNLEPYQGGPVYGSFMAHAALSAAPNILPPNSLSITSQVVVK